ncbi:hypothetical protein ACU6U9_09340 [Pseudomonas sp. HK3]
MITLTNSIYMRTRLYALSLIAWILVISLLMVHSYKVETDDVFNELNLKTEVAFMQFERHWPALREESTDVKNDYFNKLSFDFNPSLQLSAISTNGKILASNLKNLNQLSYSPIVAQLQENFALGKTMHKRTL